MAYLQWEAKAGRMLQLTMSDGTQTVHGVEYEPIQSLSTDLTPGIKVRTDMY